LRHSIETNRQDAKIAKATIQLETLIKVEFLFRHPFLSWRSRWLGG